MHLENIFQLNFLSIQQERVAISLFVSKHFKHNMDSGYGKMLL